MSLRCGQPLAILSTRASQSVLRGRITGTPWYRAAGAIDVAKPVHTIQCMEWLHRWRALTLVCGLSIATSGMLPIFAGSAVPHMLFVQVRPEAALSRQGEGTLLLKIRLAPGARAALWSATTCAAPDPGSYMIVRSGIYTLPLSVIPGPSDAGTCLASSDGAFALFLPSGAPAR